jgi:ribosomal protein S18 acetylase RimI-like enzyme
MKQIEFSTDIKLRGGASLAVRSTAPGDEEALLAFYKGLPQEERLFLRDDVTSRGWAERFIERIQRGEAASLIALAGDQVVAEATLYRATHGWSTHVGELRIAVAGSWRRKGLATALAGQLLRIGADQGADKIIVEVVQDQTPALRTFEKLGFQKEAVLLGHVKDANGIRRDLLILSNDVSHIWAAMEALVADTRFERS